MLINARTCVYGREKPLSPMAYLRGRNQCGAAATGMRFSRYRRIRWRIRCRTQLVRQPVSDQSNHTEKSARSGSGRWGSLMTMLRISTGIVLAVAGASWAVDAWAADV